MTPPPDESVAQRQARFNRSTRSHWQHFAPHRARVQELILTGRELTSGGRFCALGAGNANDLELNRLLDAFDEVHLVDIDPKALTAAAERQGVSGRPGLHLHAPVDLTGIAGIVSRWKETAPLSPSPGTPGEGRGEGLLDDRARDPRPVAAAARPPLAVSQTGERERQGALRSAKPQAASTPAALLRANAEDPHPKPLPAYDATELVEVRERGQGRQEGRRPPMLADVREAIAASNVAPTPHLGPPFDVVLSSCLLSQLVGYATDALGGDTHPGFRDLVRAIRSRHLNLIADLLAPGGTGILVCDLVSSDSRDDLPRVPEHELPGLVARLARDGNFFSGLFPDALLAACRTDPAVAPRVRNVRMLPPWLWRLGPQRTFLVYALRFRRAAGGGIVLP